MKKIFIAFLLFVVSKSYSQLLNCNSTGFTGTAPAPWAIDGSIQDWETILGLSTSDPVFPFGNTSQAYDTYGANDPDNPEPKIDIRVASVAYDDYNVYFYFRRLDNSNSAAKAFYFLDTNIDGLMSAGEPVFRSILIRKKFKSFHWVIMFLLILEVIRSANLTPGRYVKLMAIL